MNPIPSPSRPRSSHIPLGCCLALACCFGGCRSAAHNDVYIDKLAAEVRFLEDQLYQIDYENKVLREKLQRAKRAEASAKLAPPKSFMQTPKPAKTVPLDDRNNDRDRMPSEDRDDDLRDDDQDPLGPIQTPRIDLGQPQVTPPESKLPGNDSTPQIQLPDIEPGDIRPPSDSLLIPPEIDPGQIRPPGDSRNSPSLAPGKIILPASVTPQIEAAGQVELAGGQEPLDQTPGELVSLVIDPVFSRGHDFTAGGESSGVYLVIKGLDEEGRELPIDAPLQVAIMDPKRSGSQARLGRWDFDLEHVRDAWRSTAATDGIHLPIQWDNKHPLGDFVDVYCRTETATGELITTELTIDLSVHRSRAELWTPRGNE